MSLSSVCACACRTEVECFVLKPPHLGSKLVVFVHGRTFFLFTDISLFLNGSYLMANVVRALVLYGVTQSSSAHMCLTTILINALTVEKAN